jgi:arabinofuranan 3-O-arabinosyltransferase
VTDHDRPASKRALPYAAFAAVCYLPLLATRPGWISADTKSYLYIDPSRLLSRAWSMWDPQIGLGTVSHQTIGYLWPMGPWFWFFERLGVPDWVAQRLWWGTLLFAAGLGVVYLLRRFDWPPVAIWPAAVAYALTPYVLTHIARLSGVLLPYTGLPWMLALTVLAIRHRSWRHAALFALLVTTIGSINLTALVLAGLGPTLWVLYVAVTRQEPVGEIAKAVGRMGVLTVLTSAWWLAGLSVQASHGVDIVRYTETAEVVARTSTAFEIVRGLGYWFFYGGDKLQLWIEVSYQYTQRPWLIAASFAVPLLAMASTAVGRWRHQAFFVVIFITGAVVGIGAHAWDDPSPFGSAVQWFVTTPRGLAFRSLPRVVPLVALGSAVLIGAGVGAVATRWRRGGIVLSGAAALLAVVALAPLWQRGLVNDNLSRQDIPDYWVDAAADLDADTTYTRVLELPGSDFASYRWGMTVDPVTPGLMGRPIVARELVPHGAPMGTDLLNALDLRVQENTIEPASIAPLARLMRAGHILVRSDLEFERHNTARPRVVWDLISRTPGVGAPVGYGEPVFNEAGPILQHLDEQWLLYEGQLPDPHPVTVVPVTDPVSIYSLKPATSPVVLAGDGAGIVDAAAAGLIDGSELIRYAASLTPDEIRAAVGDGAQLVVTDTNRRRGERWGSLRHNRGHTERIDESALRTDLGDNRLPRFPDAAPETQSVTVQRGGITADATAYGNPITYAGEERAARAVDGDARTAWSVGVFSDARGERLRLQLDEPITTDWIRIQQMSADDSNRAITRLRLTFDGTETLDVDLDHTSRDEPGQTFTFPERTFTQIEATILADSAGDPPRFREFGPLGIVEIVLGPDSPTIDELVRVPSYALQAAAELLDEAPIAVVLTRIRQDPTDRTRDDEERAIRRVLDLPVERTYGVYGVVRLSARADDPVLDEVLGHRSDTVRVTATDRMDGSRVERAAAAIDGDPATAWTTPWGQPINHAITVELSEPHTFASLDLEVVTDGRHSVPTRVRISVDGTVVTEPELGPIDDLAEPGATTIVPLRFEPVEGTTLTIEIVAAREITSIDWTAGRPLAHPVGLAELGLPGIGLGPPPDTIDTGCRDDLVSVGGVPIGVRVSGRTTDALAGRQLNFNLCGDDVTIPAGTHDLIVAPGVDTGIDVDELVLVSDGPTGARSQRPMTAALSVVAEGPDRATVQVAGATPGEPIWFVFGQSHTDGWVASIDGNDLGPSELVDGYANGWLITPDDAQFTIELRFAPQGRVTVALAVSAIGVMVCLVLAVVDRRRGPLLPSTPPRALDVSLTHYEGLPPSLAAGAAASLVVLVAAWVFSNPFIALPLGAATLVGTRVRRARLPIALLPAALFGAAALYVLVWQVRYSIEPGIEWVTELERAHPVALAAVLSLALHPLLTRLWRGRGQRDIDPTGL